jgi:hypothetical protein
LEIKPSDKPACFACHLLDVGFLLGFIFSPEDGGNMSIQNN